MDDLIGKSIAHYTIIEKLGEGGMGAVYKAHDTRLNRPVAIKTLLRYHALDSDARAQLLNEARSAASLNHPNIATVYTIEEADDEIYIIMEYLEGEELKIRISRGPIRPDEALRIVRALAGGLKAAHAGGIIHRDIKSSNVMLTTGGLPKLMDFGIARGPSSEVGELYGQSRTGTIPYMSPEQIRGENVDSRSDIFSLGVVLYESLTGLLPFQGDHEPALVYSILNLDPRPVTEIDASIPSSVQAVIDGCLKKNRKERYSSCDAVMEAIQSSLLTDLKSEYAVTKTPAGVPQLTLDGIESGELIGRPEEESILLKRIEDACAGRGSTVFIAGEHGVGKSFLAARVLIAAQKRGMHVLHGKCFGGAGNAPYEPFVAACKRAMHQSDNKLLDVLSRNGGRDGSDLGNRLPLLNPLLIPGSPIAEGLNKEQVWEAILVLLRALSVDRPVAIVIEDLQSADEATIDLCSYLARNLTSSRICLLATYVAEEASSGGASAVLLARKLKLEGKLTQIQLDRWNGDETAKMIEHALGGKVDPVMTARIHEAARGNALFTMELLSLLRTRDAVRLAGGRWECEAGDLSLLVTDRIHDVIRQRLDRLTEQDREILNIASCEREYFESDPLVASMDVTRIELLKRLQILEDEYGLIRHEKKRYRFDHPLLRQVVYDRILEELREEYHRKFGAWLVSQHGDSPEYAGRIALHLMASGQEREAVPYLLTGADRSLSVWAVSLAKAQYGKADEILTGLGGGDAIAMRVEAGLGDVCVAEGHPVEALRHYGRCIELAHRAGDIPAETVGLRKRAAALRITGSLPDALNDGETALRSAAALGDAKEEIQSLLVLASIHSARADYTRTVQLSQQAFDRSTQIGDVGSQAVAMGTLGLAQWHLGALRKAAESLRQALVMHGSIGDSRGRATVLNYLGLTYYCLARLEEALDANKESLEIKEALAIIPAIPGSLNNIGDTYREIGDIEKAASFHREALEAARRQNNRGSECDSLRDLGTDLYRRGEFALARSHFEEVLRLARTYGYAWYEIRVMLSLAELDLAESNGESADRWSEEGMRRSRETGADQLTLEAAWTRGKVFARQGNIAEARRFLAESVAKAEAMDHRLFLWQILREVVNLEHSAGDREAGEQALRKVRQLLTEILGGFKTPELRATFQGVKEVRELVGVGT